MQGQPPKQERRGSDEWTGTDADLLQEIEDRTSKLIVITHAAYIKMFASRASTAEGTMKYRRKSTTRHHMNRQGKFLRPKK
jgi:hypothetical protein